MVTAAPNLTEVTGRVRSVAPHATLDGWVTVALDVTGTRPVEGRADLVSRTVADVAAHGAPGATGRPGEPVIEVAIRADLVPGLAAGAPLTCRVKVTPRGLMAEQHPPTPP